MRMRVEEDEHQATLARATRDADFRTWEDFYNADELRRGDDVAVTEILEGELWWRVVWLPRTCEVVAFAHAWSNTRWHQRLAGYRAATAPVPELTIVLGLSESADEARRRLAVASNLVDARGVLPLRARQGLGRIEGHETDTESHAQVFRCRGVNLALAVASAWAVVGSLVKVASPSSTAGDRGVVMLWGVAWAWAFVFALRMEVRIADRGAFIRRFRTRFVPWDELREVRVSRGFFWDAIHLRVAGRRRPLLVPMGGFEITGWKYLDGWSASEDSRSIRVAQALNEHRCG